MLNIIPLISLPKDSKDAIELLENIIDIINKGHLENKSLKFIISLNLNIIFNISNSLLSNKLNSSTLDSLLKLNKKDILKLSVSSYSNSYFPLQPIDFIEKEFSSIKKVFNNNKKKHPMKDIFIDILSPLYYDCLREKQIDTFFNKVIKGITNINKQQYLILFDKKNDIEEHILYYNFYNFITSYQENINVLSNNFYKQVKNKENIILHLNLKDYSGIILFQFLYKMLNIIKKDITCDFYFKSDNYLNYTNKIIYPLMNSDFKLDYYWYSLFENESLKSKFKKVNSNEELQNLININKNNFLYLEKEKTSFYTPSKNFEFKDNNFTLNFINNNINNIVYSQKNYFKEVSITSKINNIPLKETYLIILSNNKMRGIRKVFKINNHLVNTINEYLIDFIFIENIDCLILNIDLNELNFKKDKKVDNFNPIIFNFVLNESEFFKINTYYPDNSNIEYNLKKKNNFNNLLIGNSWNFNNLFILFIIDKKGNLIYPLYITIYFEKKITISLSLFNNYKNIMTKDFKYKKSNIKFGLCFDVNNFSKIKNEIFKHIEEYYK